MKKITKEKLMEKFGTIDFKERVVRYIGTADTLIREYQEAKKVPSVENLDPPGPQNDLFIWSARQTMRGQIKEANYRLTTLAMLKSDLLDILKTCSEEDMEICEKDQK